MSTTPGPDNLAAAWARWQPVLEPLGATARPSLLPHLRTADRDQAIDIPFSLGLSGFDVPVRAVASALGQAGTEAHLEGWPAAVPPPDPDPAASRRDVGNESLAALDGWVAGLVRSRITVMFLLQGAPTADVLPLAVQDWHAALVAPAIAAGLVPAIRAGGPRLFHAEGCPAPGDIPACLDRMWELAEDEPRWDVRGLLLHLAIQWVRPWPAANGRLARLLLNTLRVAAGHSWLTIPTDRAEDYVAACERALAPGDGGPWADLAAACATR
jgi:hypothetical protein